jgi:hypothetical protein
MTLQTIRAAIEQPVITAFDAVPVFVENQQYTDNDVLSEFALVRLQWGLMNEPSIGCLPGELIRGVLVVELFTAKGEGPGRAQEVITPVLEVLSGFGRPTNTPTRITLGQLSGPSFTPLDGRPHLMTRVSAPVRARYDET